MPVPKFEEHDTVGGYAVLLCPRCGSRYLHHAAVDVYARREDAGEGLHTRATSGDRLAGEESIGTTTDADLAGNPSSRRGGVAITFSCEECGASPRLTLAQHKGETHVELHP